jgi:hypothetical protein
LQNEAAERNHWLGLKLQGTACNRDATGARIAWSAGGKQYSRMKNGAGSYLSSHDPRQVLGLGTGTNIDWLEVHWPGPSTAFEKFTDLPTDRYITIVEGKGISASA